MCGIGGVLYKKSSNLDKYAVIERMMLAQKHRGPDADGFYHDDLIALGHRRLSIIDLSVDANQPMHDASGRYVITFNGEIYNYKQLRTQLSKYKFNSHSDTEVILAAFIEWGEACLKHLTGPFAFAIWDKKDQNLFIARDRFGEKPFYYYKNNKNFIFASELRALLASDLVPKKVLQNGVHDYLLNASVQAPKTILEDVHQLPAAHFAWVSKDKFELKKYWNIQPLSHVTDNVDYKTTCGNIKKHLDRVIDGQLMSDVPIGAFLSGGIDSSALVALMAERSEQKINTLSITFDEKQFDESRYASVVAKRFNTHHDVICLKPQDLLDGLDDYFSCVDAPSGDGPNVFIISKAAKEAGLTVALSGIGGDELFAGYRSFAWYKAFMKHGYFWHLPLAVRKSFLPLMAMLGPVINLGKLPHLMSLRKNDAAGFYELIRGSFLKSDAAGIMQQQAAFQSSSSSNFTQLNQALFFLLPKLSQFSILEFLNYTQNVLLKDADNMSMANSLEIRVPFCDHQLVEYVLSVQDNFKLGKRPKQLLVDSLDGLLPDMIVDRKKMGFSFPWGAWIKNELNSFCSDALNSLSKRDLFDEFKVRNLWETYQKQDGYGGWNRIWLMVSLEKWLQKTGVE